MVKFISYTLDNDCYTFVAENGDEMLMPAQSVILTDDNSGVISIKTIGSRKTVGIMDK